ncbi:MAG: cytidylate kinase-like family protein [Lachnospiraceae bacterium]|nr:cytidylate kinase-like family protein [Lachnospiraceae bacterium]
MKNLVITVARGFGSGGKRIASKIAHDLNINCYENRILVLASQMAGLDEEMFREVNEKMRQKSKISSFLKGLPRQRTPKPEEKFVSDDQLFQYQKEIIEQLADTESCVIVGKCADWILKDRPGVISIYIEAPRKYCLNEIMNRMGVNEETAARSITATDKYRAEYYSYYTGGNYWTNPVNYDLTINTDRVGFDGAVKLVEDYIKIKYPDFVITPTREPKVIE